jgi:DNA adenine methylase
LLGALIARLPEERIETYYEPFVGGGAFFFALAASPELAPRRAVLNDRNRELMTAFEAVRDDVDGLVERLAGFESRYLSAGDPERRDLYYEVRGEEPSAPLDIAARFIFLNKTCFNGLYRVNRRGRFNVPHGRYRKPRILDEPTLRAASLALAGVELLSTDFTEACDGVGDGDLVYVDPPFHPLSKTSSFTSYTEQDFGPDDQRRLKWCIDDLSDAGASVMLSDSPHPYILGLYEGAHDGDRARYRIESLPARRMINSRGDRRGAIDELLVTNYDPPAGPSSNGATAS